MSDSVFIDSNVLIYSYSNSEPAKQSVARKLITDNRTVISTQVLQEMANTLTKKFKVAYSDVENIIKECCGNNSLHINTEGTIMDACSIAARYGFSFYDSIIISAAIESGCTILYSEDMNHGQIIEQTLTVLNPFLQ